MRLAVLVTAACAWLRALAGPFMLLAAGAIALAITAAVGVDRLWPVALLGALLVGLAIGWAGVVSTSSSRSPNNARGDGEGESL